MLTCGFVIVWLLLLHRRKHGKSSGINGLDVDPLFLGYCLDKG